MALESWYIGSRRVKTWVTCFESMDFHLKVQAKSHGQFDTVLRIAWCILQDETATLTVWINVSKEITFADQTHTRNKTYNILVSDSFVDFFLSLGTW